MPKVRRECFYCNNEFEAWPSVPGYFCSKSCATAYRNYISNPSWFRDLSGENNPMFGKHLEAWNKGIIGEDCHNWKGGLHKRKDGYYRVTINGKRYLHHRVIAGVHESTGLIVHHKDHNPSNNDPENLMIFPSQSEHVKYENAE